MTTVMEKGKVEKALQKRWTQTINTACKAAERACMKIYRGSW